jgi:hypothetical protein
MLGMMCSSTVKVCKKWVACFTVSTRIVVLCLGLEECIYMIRAIFVVRRVCESEASQVARAEDPMPSAARSTSAT